MRKTYFLTIFRNLWKNRVSSSINVLGLTLGISSVLFLYVQEKYEGSFDVDQPKADLIYRVNLTMEYPNRTQKDGNTQSMLAKAMRNEFPELESVFQIIGPLNGLVAINPSTSEERVYEEERNIFFGDSAFLKHIDYNFIVGNKRTALDDFNSIVLSDKLVEKYYPSYIGREIDLLGKEIGIFDSLRVFVTGVIDSPPSNSNFPFQALVSSEIYYRITPWDRNNWFNVSAGLTFAVLKPGQRPEDFDKRFPDLIKKYRKDEGAKITKYSLLNLKELHRAEEWGYAGNYTDSSALAIAFSAVGLFILLSACINFINLQTAQSVNRSKEVGMRKVLGSSRSHLIIQFLVETSILTTISFFIALWITELMLGEWNGLLSIVNMDMQLDWSTFFFGLGLVVVVTFLAGIYPALKLSSFQPSEVLKSGFSLLNTKKEGLNLRQILVVVQFIITQLLIIASIVVAFQMNYFINKDMGFNKEGMITVTTYKPDRQKIDRLVQGLSSMPEVASFSLSSGPPMDAGRYGTSFIEVGHEDKGEIRARNKFIDHRFLENFQIDLVAGRNFREDEYNQKIEGFIVNEALTKQLAVDNPQEAVGKVLDCYGVKAPIVGVTQDFNYETFTEEIGAFIMFARKSEVNGADLKLAAKDLKTLLPKLRELWLEVFPNRSFEYMTMDDFFLKAYIVEDIMLKCVRIFSFVAIIIGCLGLYGLVSFLAVKKTKEIGIRKVLGASFNQILYIFSKRFFVLILIAFVISAPLAYKAMSLWLDNYAYRISLSWEIFALGLLATLLLTVVTVSYISLRAARANPAETLQFE